MKRTLLALALIGAIGPTTARAQARVSVSIGFGVPAPYVVYTPRPYHHRYRYRYDVYRPPVVFVVPTPVPLRRAPYWLVKRRPAVVLRRHHRHW